MAYEVTPEMYIPELAQETQTTSLQEKADFNQKVAFENTANDLANRKSYTTDIGVADNESVSLGAAKAEQRLMEVQQELYNCTDSTKSSLLQIEAQKLAEMLTGSVTSSEEKAPEPIDDVDDVNSDDEIIATHGKEKVDQVLSWAGENLDQSTSEAINAHFEAGYGELAYQTLDTLQSNPEYIQSEHTSFNEVEAAQLVEQFGEHGSDLVTLNAMLSEGKVSKGKVLSHIMASPDLMRSAYQAAQAGLLKFSV